MNYSSYPFTLDIHGVVSQISFPVSLHDTARTLLISLTDGGKPYTIADGCRAVISAVKADGTRLLNDCITVGNKIIRYDFTPQTAAAVGKVDCEVRLYGEDGNLVTSPRFTIVVYEGLVDERIVSEDEKTSIDRILASEQQRVAAELAREEAEVVRNETMLRAEAAADRVAENINGDDVFIRYSAYADGRDYTATWRRGLNYIGVAAGLYEPTDASGYEWSLLAPGVYVGTGEMPDYADVQIVPEGEDSKTVRHEFIVNEDSEAEYLVSSDGVWNESGGYRYHDKGAASVWRYPIEDAASVSSALWHGHTAQQTLLQASVDGKSWAVLIDNGSQKKGHQDYIEICDYVDIAASGTSWLYIRIGDSNAGDGGGGAILNDIPVTMDITCGLISPYTLPEVSEADNGKWLRVVNGQWRKVGGENVVSRVQNYNFTVGEADENEHITGQWGTLNANHRYADNDAKITYHYHLANSSQIRGLVWSAECGNQLHIEVSYDGKTWQDVLNTKGEKLNFERRVFDLMPYMGNRGLLCYDELYIRIGDSNYDQSNPETHDGFGGALSRGTVVELRTERFELPFGF